MACPTCGRDDPGDASTGYHGADYCGPACEDSATLLCGVYRGVPMNEVPRVVYVAIYQPDGDWDHIATVIGVYSTPETARSRATGAQIYAVTIDANNDSLRPMRE